MPPGSELREKLRLSTFPPSGPSAPPAASNVGPLGSSQKPTIQYVLADIASSAPSRVPRPHSVDGAPDRARARRPSLSSEEGTTHCRITFSRARIIPRTVWSLNIAAVKPGATTGNLASY